MLIIFWRNLNGRMTEQGEGVSSDNIIGQKKDLFILNDKFTIKDKASVVKIIYDYEKQLNTQVLFFYKGTEEDMVIVINGLSILKIK